MGKRGVEVVADKAAIAERACDLVVERIEKVLESQPFCSIVLSGGSTPKPLYQSLAKRSLPWKRLLIFWGDERYVPSDHPDSNEKMAREAWLDQVPIPAAQIFAMPTASDDVGADAEDYAETVRNAFEDSESLFVSAKGAGWTWDIVLLGMGDDGHTASLFPGTAILDETEKLVSVGQKGDQPRISLTLPALNRSDWVVFLVAGENKQTPLEQVMPVSLQGRFGVARSPLSQQYPSCAVQPSGDLLWLLDQSASATLPPDLLT
ncbi:MAG: 6-phosphogluconolactonase [Cyanobacteria bacterium P01_C01_bin.89]